jgi:hypothetical protein
MRSEVLPQPAFASSTGMHVPPMSEYDPIITYAYMFAANPSAARVQTSYLCVDASCPS